jgi:hypothetical protein
VLQHLGKFNLLKVSLPTDDLHDAQDESRSDLLQLLGAIEAPRLMMLFGSEMPDGLKPIPTLYRGACSKLFWESPVSEARPGAPVHT